MKRDFSLILWGASGFTGRLTAHYIQKNYGAQLRWALGGRNEGKLKKIQEELKQYGYSSPEIVVGDSLSSEDMHSIAKKTQVLCSTVGPYAAYGSILVGACVEEKTHYCDLTGESVWIRSMIDAHHETAVKNKVRIVHCCGFDSIPSDLGVYLLQTQSQEVLGKNQTQVDFYAGKSKGGFSGGTVASMMLMMEQAKDPQKRKVLGNPYGLNPKDGFRGPDGSDQMGLRYDKKIEGWTAPFIMAGINTRVVRRSNALLEYSYGKKFRYREVMSLPKGVRGWAMGLSVTTLLAGFILASSIPPIRKYVLARFLPKPGEGPNKELRENGYFNIMIKGEDAYVKVKGFQDPGYGETSKMLGESAMCLVLDEQSLPDSYGVVTPASSMGERLLQRLREAGMVFSFHTD